MGSLSTSMVALTIELFARHSNLTEVKRSYLCKSRLYWISSCLSLAMIDKYDPNWKGLRLRYKNSCLMFTDFTKLNRIKITSCHIVLQVEINIQIRSMGPVDEESQTFTMDCYFRQYWNDFRLKFKDRGLIELPMNWQFLTKIWRPDTVFINGKNSYLHKMTVRYHSYQEQDHRTK